MGRVGDQLGVVEKRALGGGETRVVELARQDGCDAIFSGSLNTQEVGVAVQSIRAAIEVRDPARDHLLVPTRKMAFGEMHSV